jgi:hypothetical protein
MWAAVTGILAPALTLAVGARTALVGSIPNWLFPNLFAKLWGTHSQQWVDRSIRLSITPLNHVTGRYTNIMFVYIHLFAILTIRWMQFTVCPQIELTCKVYLWKCILFPKFFLPNVKKIVLVIKKNFWNSRLKAENMIFKYREHEILLRSPEQIIRVKVLSTIF